MREGEAVARREEQHGKQAMPPFLDRTRSLKRGEGIGDEEMGKEGDAAWLLTRWAAFLNSFHGSIPACSPSWNISACDRALQGR
jgi:hypothetical protein